MFECSNCMLTNTRVLCKRGEIRQNIYNNLLKNLELFSTYCIPQNSIMIIHIHVFVFIFFVCILQCSGKKKSGFF